MNYCGKITWAYNSVSAHTYNTQDRLKAHLLELAKPLPDPIYALQEWIDTHRDNLQRYLSNIDVDNFRETIQYQLEDNSGEEESSPESTDDAQFTTTEDKQYIQDKLKTLQDADLQDAIQTVFGGNHALRISFQQKFSKDLMLAYIYYNNGNEYRLVNSTSRLNKSLFNYRKSQYNQIYKFLKEYDPSFELQDENGNVVDNIFTKDGEVIEKSLKQLLDQFQKVMSENQHVDMIQEGQIDIYHNKTTTNAQFLLAAQAYLSVKYFDSLLKDQLGDIISVAEKETIDVEQGLNVVEIEQDKQGRDHKVIYNIVKYNFGRDKSTAIKSWNIGEFRDAIKELAKLSTLLINTVEVRDAFNDHKLIRNQLTVAEMYTAMQNVRNIISSHNDLISKGQLLSDILNRVDNNPNRYIPYLFDLILALPTDYKKYFLQNNTIHIIYSIYNTFFAQNQQQAPSLRDIENRDVIKSGSLPPFLIQDVIINALSQMSSANYIYTEILADEANTDYIKPKDRQIKQQHDWMDSISLDMSTMRTKEREKLVQNITLENASEITFEINGQRYHAYAMDSKRENLQPIFGNAVVVDIYRELTTGDQTFLDELIKNYSENYRNLTQPIYKKPFKEALQQLINATADPAEKSKLQTFQRNVSTIQLPSIGKININNILDKNNSEEKIIKARNILSFIDPFLRLRFSTKDGLYNLSFTLTKNGDDDTSVNINSLIKTAIRIAAQHKIMYDYAKYKELPENTKTLQEYMLERGLGDATEYLTTQVNGITAFRPLYDESWISSFFEAQAALDGTDKSSTTKDSQHNSLALFRPINVASKYMDILRSVQKMDDNTPAKASLFVKYPNLIKSMSYDKEVKTYNDNFATEKMSVHQLFLNNIVYKFFNSYLTTGIVHITPTVYADKKAFGTFGLNGQEEIVINGVKAALPMHAITNLDQLYKETTSEFYQKSLRSILNRFEALFIYISYNADETTEQITRFKDVTDKLNEQGKTLNLEDKASMIQDILSTINYKTLEKWIGLYNSDVAEYQQNGKPLDDRFKIQKNLELSLNGHYIKRKDGTLSLNEIAVGYNIGYNIDHRLQSEKKNFIEQILKYNVSFDATKGSIIYQAWSKFGLKSEDLIKSWATKTGSQPYKLILAKAKIIDNNGKIQYKNIYTLNDLYKANDIELNPLLEKYFYLYNIYSKNIMMFEGGYEIGDDDKTSNIDMQKEFDVNSLNSNDVQKTQQEIDLLNNLATIDPAIIDALKSKNLTDLILDRKYFSLADPYSWNTFEEWAADYRNLQPDDNRSDSELRTEWDTIIKPQQDIQNNRNSLILELLELKINRLLPLAIASREASEFKRNMSLTATITPFQINSITGVGRYTNMAVFDDVQAFMYNPNGDAAKEDAHDGSAMRSPHQADMENCSLGANAAGYEVAKTVGYFMDYETGVFTLAKWATPTLTNGYMKMGQGSDHDPYLLYKKMHDRRWNGKWDLLTNHDISKLNGQEATPLNFKNEILSYYLINDHKLLYKHNNIIYEIKNLDKIQIENGPSIYITIEQQVDDRVSNNKKNNTSHFVAQLFDSNQNLYRVRSKQYEDLDNDANKQRAKQEFAKEIQIILQDNPQLHTIDSLYELHQTLGGLESVQKGERGGYTTSENSIHAVSAFMNAVTIQKQDFSQLDSPLNQDVFDQPLKRMLIGYAANKSSMKKYQRNINSVEKITNDEPIIYFTADNQYFGISQDPDHEADEANVREMSQVIASLDAGGQAHTLSRQAYQDLEYLSRYGMKKQVDLLAQVIAASNEELKPEEIASKIYHIIVNDLLHNSISKDKIDLSSMMIQKVKQIFGKQVATKHGQQLIDGEEEYLLPISDPNIFNNAVNAIAKTISEASLERKYEGSGDVLIPGYKKVQIYHLLENNEEIDLTYDDILQKASKERFNITQRNNKPVFTAPLILPRNIKAALQNCDINNGKLLGDAFGSKYILYTLLAIDQYMSYGATIQLGSFIDENGEEIEDIEDINRITSIYHDILINLGYIYNDSEKTYTKSLTKESLINKLLVNYYLADEQWKQQYLHMSADWFQPSDIVDVYYTDDELHNHILTTIDLNTREEYYNFIDYFDNDDYKTKTNGYYQTYLLNSYNAYSNNPQNTPLTFDEFKVNVALTYNEYVDANIDEIAEKLGVVLNGKYYKYLKFALRNDIKYKENITKPKDLRPQRITFLTEDGKRHNIYELDAVKQAHYSEMIKEGKQFVPVTNATRDNQLIQQQIKDLTKRNVAHLNGREIAIVPGSVDVQAAEAIISNNYKTKFGQGDASMYECISNFKMRDIQKVVFQNSDLILLSDKQKYGVIISDTLDVVKNFTKLKRNEIISEVNNDYVIYNASKDGDAEYEVGKLVVKNGYSYRDNNYYDEKNNIVENKDNLYVLNDIVYEKQYFVEYYQSIDKGKKHTYIFINKNHINGNNDKEKDQYIASILNKIIENKKLSTVQLNGVLQPKKIATIKNVLQSMKDSFAKNAIKNYSIDKQIAFLQTLTNINQNDAISLYSNEYNYDRILKDINKYKAKIQKQYFEMSRFLLAARIPSQSLQSYMQMKAVAYMPTGKNQIIVSHFQTWLQGSDYDIDKAYIMGYAFTNNGEFYDWSPLFDWSSSETVKSSLKLLTPKGRHITSDLSGGLNLDSQIQEIIGYRNIIETLSQNDSAAEGVSTSLFELTRDTNPNKPNNYNLTIKNIDTNNIVQIAYMIASQLPNGCTVTLNMSNPDPQILRTYLSLQQFGFNIISESWLDINDAAGNFIQQVNVPVYKLHKDKLINIFKSRIIDIQADMLNQIDIHNNGNIHSNGTKEFQDEIDKIKSHEEFLIQSSSIENTFKNSIAARIQQIISDPLNMQLAYSPIEMRDVRAGARKSPLANVSKQLTTMNPATQFIMQQQNMEGKDDIGIFAVGERIFMGLTYYLNEYHMTSQSANRLKQFIHTSTRIQNRSVNANNPEFTIRTTIDSSNFYDQNKEYQEDTLQIDRAVEKLRSRNLGLSDEELRTFVKNIVAAHTQADLVISQLLSAATDNAKELILTCINAGSDFAKMYIHLVILGYNIKDIISFMTCKTVQLVTDLSREYGFLDTKPKVYKIIEQLKNGKNISNILERSIKDSIESSTNVDKETKNIIARLKGKDLYLYLLHNQDENINNILHDILDSNTDAYSKDLIIELLRLNERVSTIEENEFKQDLDEFDKIYNDSQETSNIGTWLGLVRKINPVYENFINAINTTERTVNTMFRSLNISYQVSENVFKTIQGGIVFKFNGIDQTGVLDLDKQEQATIKYIIEKTDGRYNELEIKEILKEAAKQKILRWDKGDKKGPKWKLNFKFDLFSQNREYKQAAINLYDLFKRTYNILDIVSSIPHYNAAVDAWNTTRSIINIGSIKGSIVKLLVQNANQDFYKPDERAIRKFVDYADELLIMNFAQQLNFSFDIQTGDNIYDKNLNVIQAKHNEKRTIKEPLDIQTYKIWFEESFLPQLLSGSIVLDGEEYIIDEGNEFLLSLQSAKDGQLILKKLDLFMDLVTANIKTSERYQKILSDFKKLDRDVPKGKRKITDYFMFYNLIVSRNNPGRDRMTSLFSDRLYYGDTLLDKYSQYLAKLEMESKQYLNDDDSNLETFLMTKLKFNYNDAAIRSAKLYSYRTTKHNGEMYIYERQADGSIVLKVKDGNSYIDAKKESGFIYDYKTINERKIIEQNFANNGHIFYFPFGMNNDLIMSKLQITDNTFNKENLISAYRDLMLRGILNIQIHC